MAGRVALVTGGTRGIGRAISEALKNAGYTVAANYAGNDAAAEQFSRETGIKAYKFDVSNFNEVQDAVKRITSDLGPVDIVVNNAGIWDEDPAGEGRLDVWDRTYAINQRGAFLVTDAAVPHLAKTRGTIVFVSSTAGQRGEARHSAYAASKGALISYTKSLAAELGPRGIRVNCVAPGWVDTEMSAGALGNPIERAEIEKLIPIGRVASAADIAGPILFLVSDLARHLQGEVVNVNGGSVLAG